MDSPINYWDKRAGELVRQSAGHSILFNFSIAPDGESAFFGSSDRTVTQWRLSNPSLDQLRDWIQANRYVRDLTCEEQDTFQIEASQGEGCAP